MTAIHTVDVLGKSYAVSVHQKSKSLWVARGDYKADTIKAEERTEGAALTRWYEQAANGTRKRAASYPRQESRRKNGISARRQAPKLPRAKAAAKRK